MLRTRTIILIAIAAYGVFLASRGWSSDFTFNKYEGFLGIGNANADAATSAFLRKFPIGTPLDRYREYFAQIGGHCDEIQRYNPNTPFCGYTHLRYPPLP